MAEHSSGPRSNDPPDGSAAAILLAAGTGERLGLGVPKAFAELCGRPMFVYALQAMAGSGVIASVVLVVPPGWEGVAREVAAGEAWPGRLEVVAGGSTRQESVRQGLQAIGSGVRFVLCHDAARPLARPELFRLVLEPLVAGRAEGAVPVVPSPDTVKRVRGGLVMETTPREELGLAQTPQAFVIEALRSAHLRAAWAGLDATDDATLLEAAGLRVAAVAGEPSNFKVTTRDDLARAAALLGDPARAARSDSP